MESNTHSDSHPAGWPDRLAALEAALDGLATPDTGGLPDANLALVCRAITGRSMRAAGS
jgi:hypothetical protein